MADRDLPKLIADLRDEIDQLSDDDVRAKQRLSQLVESLEQRLADPASAEHDKLVDNVQETIRQFEVEHPRTTGVLNHIMMTLSNMGI
jgi:hypothetical protein